MGSQLSINANDAAIDSCLNVKFDKFHKVSLENDLKNDLSFHVNRWQGNLVNSNASKTTLLSFKRMRKPFLIYIIMAVANIQESDIFSV